MQRILPVSVAAFVATCIVGSLLFIGHTQALPAPTVDRVGFPAGYKDTFKLFYVFDNYQNRQIRKVYGNAISASVKAGETFNFPYGSVILFESWSVREDASGEPVLDEQGRLRANVVVFIDGQRSGLDTPLRSDSRKLPNIVAGVRMGIRCLPARRNLFHSAYRYGELRSLPSDRRQP